MGSVVVADLRVFCHRSEAFSPWAFESVVRLRGCNRARYPVCKGFWGRGDNYFSFEVGEWWFGRGGRFVCAVEDEGSVGQENVSLRGRYSRERGDQMSSIEVKLE